MVKHGIKGVIGGGAAVGGASDVNVRAWRDALARGGREAELGDDLAITFSTHIADTQEKAMAEAESFFEEHMKMFAPLGFVRGLTDEQVRATADPAKARHAGLPTLRDAVDQGSWLCGPPEHIVTKLAEVQERYPGLQYVNVGSVVGTPQSVVLEQLERFAEEVMPAFQSSVSAVGGARG